MILILLCFSIPAQAYIYTGLSQAEKSAITAKIKGGHKDLVRVNLYGMNLAGVDLSGAKLSMAYLSWSNLKGANLNKANLNKANLKGTNLKGANLRGADLRGAILTWAGLEGADFTGANLGYALIDVKYRGKLKGVKECTEGIGWITYESDPTDICTINLKKQTQKNKGEL